MLLKDCSPLELTAGVRAVAAGEAMLASTLTARLVKWFRGVDVDAAQTTGDLLKCLNRPEGEVLAAVAKGMGNLEIARVA